MTLTLEKYTSQNAKGLIADALRSNVGETALKKALIADHIRSAIFSRASMATMLNANAGLHTTRLLTSARKAADLVWPGTAVEAAKDSAHKRDTARETLDAMSVLGDVANTGGGFWIGTPFRLVPCESRFLVLGCVPNAFVKAATGSAPICAGVMRLAEVRPSLTPTVHNVITPVATWLGTSEKLSAWTTRTIAEHESHLAKGDEVSASQLEVFAPELLTRTQRNPWIPCASVTGDMHGVRLCRPLAARTFVWDRPHYLAKLSFRSGELSVLSYIRIDPSLRSRLRFGLSSLANATLTIAAAIRGNLAELELPRGLPEPEACVASLGWPVSSDQRRFQFHRYLLPVLSEVLARLDIRIVER